MDFLTIAQQRYTTKKYLDSAKIAENDILKLKEILRLSPSSINSQPWHFTFVSDEKIKAELASHSFFNQQKINEASHLVVFHVINDLQKFEDQINEHLPVGSVNYYHTFLKPLPAEDIKAWLKNQVYLSLGFFLAACASLNIDSTPMEGIKTDEYDKVLKLDGYQTLFAVAIGRRNPEDANQPSLKAKARINLETMVSSL